jgi:hypothetical protein
MNANRAYLGTRTSPGSQGAIGLPNQCMRIGGWRQIGAHRQEFVTSIGSVNATLGGLRDGSPLHIVRRVAASAIERLDVIHHESGAGALHRFRRGTRFQRSKCTDRPGVARDVSAQITYAVEAGGGMPGARQWQFRDGDHLGAQNGAERDREWSDSEEWVFRGHRLYAMHVGCPWPSSQPLRPTAR